MGGFITRRRAAVVTGVVGSVLVLAACDTGNFNIRFVVGEAGIILKTSNAGGSWSQQASGVTKNLNGVAFDGSAVDGCAVGDDGTITYTTDGSTWTAAASGTVQQLNSVDIAGVVEGSDQAWAVGAKGTILHSTDACATWSAESSGTPKNLNGVGHCRCTGLDVWAVGDYGHIFVTTDGVNWSPQVSGTGQTLESVVFVDSDTGWAVGKRGVILHTVNGGTTWSPQSSGTTLSLDGVDFADSSHGYAVGAGGLILFTSDGGTTWTAQTSHTTNFLESVSTTYEWCGPPETECSIGDWHDAIVVGKGGIILMTQNGGTTWTKFNGGTTNDLGGTA